VTECALDRLTINDTNALATATRSESRENQRLGVDLIQHLLIRAFREMIVFVPVHHSSFTPALSSARASFPHSVREESLDCETGWREAKVKHLMNLIAVTPVSDYRMISRYE